MPNRRKYPVGTDAHAARRQTLAGRTQELFNNARSRAKARGLPFTLTRDWIMGALSSGRCAMTDLPFEFNSRSPHAPSIDQIDPHGGYTPENSRLVVAIFNYAKNIWTDDAVKAFCEAFLRRSSV